MPLPPRSERRPKWLSTGIKHKAHRSQGAKAGQSCHKPGKAKPLFHEAVSRPLTATLAELVTAFR